MHCMHTLHTYMHCMHTLHYITLHYITLHYITLHYITLHYITYIHTYIYIYIHTYIHTNIYINIYIYILYIYVYIYNVYNWKIGVHFSKVSQSALGALHYPKSHFYLIMVFKRKSCSLGAFFGYSF